MVANTEKRFREQRPKFEQMLREAGITRYEFVRSETLHWRVVFYRDGNPRAYHVGFANSDDWRAMKNSMSDLRKRIEESKNGRTNGGHVGHPGVSTAQPGR